MEDAVDSFLESHQFGENDDQVLCLGCGDLILDRYLLKVDDAYYHEGCAKCDVCMMQMMDRCYKREGKLYCKTHYYRLFSPYQCCGCGEGVSPLDMVYKVQQGTLLYHVQCHRCAQCGRLLTPGERIVVDTAARLIACCQHFEQTAADIKLSVPPANGHEAPAINGHDEATDIKPVSMIMDAVQAVPPTLTSNGEKMQIDSIGSNVHSPNSSAGYYPSTADGSFDYDQYCIDERGFLKRRGPRTTIKQSQLDVLNRIFNNAPKPTKHARAKLALETGLSMRVIQVWFQNRRSKERRLKHLCNWIRESENRGLIPPLSPMVSSASFVSRPPPSSMPPPLGSSPSALALNGGDDVHVSSSFTLPMTSSIDSISTSGEGEIGTTLVEYVGAL